MLRPNWKRRLAAWSLGLITSAPTWAATDHLLPMKGMISATFKELLPNMLWGCELSPECRLENDERQLLHSILRSYQESVRLTRFEYVSERDRPDLFKSPETPFHRLVVTGNRVGSVIYFNTDALSRLSMPELVSILTHELGHHQGHKDGSDRLLDRLGAKLRAFISTRGQALSGQDFNLPQYSLELWSPAADLQVVPNDQPVSLRTQYLLTHPGGALLFDAPEIEIIACPQLGVDGRLLRFEISNLQWQEPSYGRNESLALLATGKARLTCFQASSKSLIHKTADIAFQFRVHMDEQKKGTLVPQSVVSRLIQSDIAPDLSWGTLNAVSSRLDSNQNGNNWKLSTSVDLNSSAARSVKSCTAYYMAAYAPEIPTMSNFKNHWPARTCKISEVSGSRISVEIDQDFPAGSPGGKYSLRSIAFETDDGIKTLLPTKREQVEVTGSGQIVRYEAAFSSHRCPSGSDSNCYAVLGLEVPLKSPIRYIEVLTGTFVMDDRDLADDSLVYTLFDAADSSGRFSTARVEETSRGNRVLVKIPKTSALARGGQSVLISYRILTDRFEVVAPEFNGRLEIIQP